MDDSTSRKVETASTAVPISYPYEELYWIVSQVIIAVVACYLLYVLTSISVYTCIRNHRKEQRTLLKITLASIMLGIGRVISDEFVAILGWQTDDLCLYSVSASIAFYYLSFAAVYAFLWLRQYYFYQKPLLRRLVNKKLLYISRGTLVFLVIFSLAVALLFEIPEVTGWDYRATTTGCRDDNDQQDVEVVLLLQLGVTVLGQISLLGLLIYPFLATRKSQKQLHSAVSVSFSARPPSPKPDNLLLRRAVLGSYQESQRNLPSLSDTTLRIQQKDNDKNPLHNKKTSLSEDEVFVRNSDYTSDSNRSHASTDWESDYASDKPCCSKNVSGNKKLRKKRRKPPMIRSNTSESINVHRHEVRKKKSKKKSKNINRGRSSSQAKKAFELSQLIKKVFLLALLCVLSDMLTLIIQLVLVVPELPYLALYDVNLVINITCILVSFRDWRDILYPYSKIFCRSKAKLSKRRSSTVPIVSVNSRTTSFSKPTRFPSPRTFQTYVAGLSNDDAISSPSSATAESSRQASPRPTSPEIFTFTQNTVN